MSLNSNGPVIVTRLSASLVYLSDDRCAHQIPWRCNCGRRQILGTLKGLIDGYEYQFELTILWRAQWPSLAALYKTLCRD